MYKFFAIALIACMTHAILAVRINTITNNSDNEAFIIGFRKPSLVNQAEIEMASLEKTVIGIEKSLFTPDKQALFVVTRGRAPQDGVKGPFTIPFDSFYVATVNGMYYFHDAPQVLSEIVIAKDGTVTSHAENLNVAPHKME